MQNGAPRRRPMSMRIVLSSMQRPRDVTGKVCNQAPNSFLEADRSLALDKGSGAVARSSATMEETLGRSHDFCPFSDGRNISFMRIVNWLCLHTGHMLEVLR